MGRMSELMIELAEERYENEKAEWIRNELGDDDADETTQGWSELALEYDRRYADADSYSEDEYMWLFDQDYSAPYISFHQTMSDIKELLSSSVKPNVIHTIRKMAYIHAVTALETYLGDTLKQLVIGNKKYITNAAKNISTIKKKTLTPYEVISDPTIVDKIVLEQLRGYLYHDIVKIMSLYRDCLDFKFPYDLKQLINITKKRHHFVHRNGKDNDGSHIPLDKVEVESAVNEIANFVHSLDKALLTYREAKHP